MARKVVNDFFMHGTFSYRGLLFPVGGAHQPEQILFFGREE